MKPVMEYRMEPVESEKLTQWIIELEVGKGLMRNIAVLTDLRRAKSTFTRDGNLSVKGGKTITLPLDELPSWESACETCDKIALALLEAQGKARPSDLVLFVIHDGLTFATAHKRPAWHSKFRYVAVEVETAETSVPWWNALGNLDDSENPRKPQ